jgi:hypothetical protein
MASMGIQSTPIELFSLAMNYLKEDIVCYICTSKSFEEESTPYSLSVLVDSKSAV